jgi:hypothetical protein
MPVIPTALLKPLAYKKKARKKKEKDKGEHDAFDTNGLVEAPNMYVRVYVCMHLCMPAGARSARSMYVCIYLYTTNSSALHTYTCILFLCTNTIFMYKYLLQDVLPLGGVDNQKHFVIFSGHLLIKNLLDLCLYTRAYISIHMYLYTHTQTHICLCVCVCARARARVGVCV